MMKKESCTAIVLAAGKGTRMGSEIPKQFLHILEKPVLYYSLKCFQESQLIDDIVLVTSLEHLLYCKEEIVQKYGLSKVTHVVCGGAERYDSVYEGLKACTDTTYVFIHDGARPFVTEEMLERGLIEVRKSGACVAGVPSKDTVKMVGEGNVVTDTPDRNRVWLVQTPQIFEHQLILDAYRRLQETDKTGVTDDAMVVEKMGNHPVYMFMGDYRNIKITTVEDLDIAEVFAKKM